MIPRIRGRVGQADEGPPEVMGKWFFEILLTSIGGGEGESLGQFGPWDTEPIARQELERAVKLVTEKIEKEMTGKVSGQYIDMKTNSLRRWDKSDEM